MRDMTEPQARRLAADPKVAYVQRNLRVSIQETQRNPVRGLDRIDQRPLPLNANYVYPDNAANNVRAYVLDTGILTTHQEFEGRASHGFDFIDDDPVAEDCHGHGTHVAGTIAGRTFGVAKRARVVGVRVLDCAGFADADSVLAGIEWVTRNGVRPAVVNMSLGSHGENPAVTPAPSRPPGSLGRSPLLPLPLDAVDTGLRVPHHQMCRGGGADPQLPCVHVRRALLGAGEPVAAHRHRVGVKLDLQHVVAHRANEPAVRGTARSTRVGGEPQVDERGVTSAQHAVEDDLRDEQLVLVVRADPADAARLLGEDRTGRVVRVVGHPRDENPVDAGDGAAARSTQRPRGRLSPSFPVSSPGASFRISSRAATALSDSGRSGRLRPRRQ